MSVRFSGIIAAVLFALLTACGGGGGGGAAPPPSAAVGSVSISLAGSGAPSGVQHVWVTLTSLALNADADRPWSASDASWQVTRLSSPVTLDLVSLVNGDNHPLVIGQALPPGSYGQLRLFLLPHDATLSASARQQHLASNEQVDWIDAAGSGRSVPLETPDAGMGLRVAGPIVVTENNDTDITLQWDLQHGLVPFTADDGSQHFTLRPDLRWYDLSNTGAIVGVLDKSLFCASGVRASGCIYDAVATAVLPSADGSTKRVVRSSPIELTDTVALFGLYPLPATGSFDVVIRGRNMQTMVVRAVTVEVKDLLAAAPTQLGAAATPMQPVLQAEGGARLAAPMARTASQLLFMQTLPGDVPMEISAADVDPFSGLLSQALPLASGPLRVATYDGSTALSFADATPAEGNGGYTVLSLGTRYDAPSTVGPVQVSAGATSAFTAGEPQPIAGLGSATLTVTVGGGSLVNEDAAELVVSDVNGIVLTRDVTSAIGDSRKLALSVPAGAAAAALDGGAVYSVAVRSWKRASPTGSVQWSRAATAVDLRDANAGSASVTLP
jgi:hypothetical protein